MKIIIPTSLGDIKLSQYQKFIKESNGIEDETILGIKTISIFCNLTENQVKAIPHKEIEPILETINNCFNEKPRLQTIIKHNGKKYGFIPNNFEKLTFGEFTDIDTYLRDVKDYDKAMKVLYRPITHQRGVNYLIEDYNPNSESLDLTLDVVFGAVGFFLHLLKDLLNSTQRYIVEAVTTDEKVWNLVKNGVGINHFTHLLAEISSSSKKLVG